MEKPSLMELKRQQWAREREEAKIDWCPWGRPGCGAPLKWNRSSARSDSRLTPVDNKKNDNYLPPLNWTTGSHQHEQVQQAPPATAPPPPPPPPRRSKRHAISHTVTDGETSGYQSDNHFIDPSAPNYHLRHRRQLSSSRGPSVEPMPDTSNSSNVIIHHHHSTNQEQINSNRHDEANEISARADYKFLERKKWVQDGTVPYDLYPECLPQLYDRSTPPRWVARPTNAFVQTEPLMSDRTLGDSSSISRHQAVVQHCATNAAPSFLRGQNVVVDVAELAERERKRAKANELQRVLLQQLAEKENQKLLEKKRQQEEEERQELELQRHLEAERRQIEEERRRVQEKKEAEERRLEAVKEAIAGAQQNALAEKLARRRNLQNRTAVVQPASDNDPVAASVSVRSEDRSTPAHQHQLQPTQREPTELRHAIISTPRPQQLDKGTLTRSSVDAQVQTDQQQLQVACRCETNNPRSRQSRHKIAATTEEERPGTQMSMIAVKSQTSTSTTNRPQWNAHKTNAKYQSQTEKDPRFLQRRRERLRRRQKLLLEKQLHGSWPSSENSGGTGVPHERYYEALQAAAVSRYYKKAPAVNHHQHNKLMAGRATSQSDNTVELIIPQPAQLVSQPPVAPTVRSQSRQLSSPPVPAVLKKIQMSNGEPAAASTSSGGEKHEWENYDSPSDQPVKIDKDFENLQIKEQRRCTEQDKQDLLYRLSVLKQSLEQRKTALDKVSLTSQ
ncbi:coiled-coil domain-containing protein 66-like isoform X2 [Daphnia pulex]|uniref:coiled-coil domain-containing protein 66-like isoform X2 n=1 Tax=Daphnia pulex TaxID=6669 RepID=UPI001EDE793C|nr:coiled-coil domain-containing protein 66-like isoform X2 [Daphnia pulex]